MNWRWNLWEITRFDLLCRTISKHSKRYFSPVHQHREVVEFVAESSRALARAAFFNECTGTVPRQCRVSVLPMLFKKYLCQHPLIEISSLQNPKESATENHYPEDANPGETESTRATDATVGLQPAHFFGRERAKGIVRSIHSSKNDGRRQIHSETGTACGD
jgi:hypothetical protein